MGDSPKWVKSRRRRKKKKEERGEKEERKLVKTMDKLRMAHASRLGQLTHFTPHHPIKLSNTI